MDYILKTTAKEIKVLKNGKVVESFTKEGIVEVDDLVSILTSVCSQNFVDYEVLQNFGGLEEVIKDLELNFYRVEGEDEDEGNTFVRLDNGRLSNVTTSYVDFLRKMGF